MAKKKVLKSTVKQKNNRLVVIYRKISELNQSEYNPRSLSKASKLQIEDSVKKFGFVDPIVINKHPSRKDIVIGGHQRLKIALALDIEEIPTVSISLPKAKEKELNIRLNKNSGEWDWNKLTSAFNRDDLEDWGFTAEEFETSAIWDKGFSDNTVKEENIIKYPIMILQDKAEYTKWEKLKIKHKAPSDLSMFSIILKEAII